MMGKVELEKNLSAIKQSVAQVFYDKYF